MSSVAVGEPMSTPGVMDFAQVTSVFGNAAATYSSAQPFPHAAFTGLFDRSVLDDIVREFPSPQEMAGSFYGEIEGGKYTESDWGKFGPVTQEFVSACNSGPFLHALSALTGIEGLLADPYLAGGGQHQSVRGARLKVHSDFNVHPSLNLTRRLNMLVYLNDPWEDSWGGSLDLWNADMSQAVVSIPPRLGQVAIFSTTDTSFHGLPDPLDCPDGVTRKSLAFYYFTADNATLEPRSTLWKERPGEDFLSRPSARLRKSASLARQSALALFKKS